MASKTPSVAVDSPAPPKSDDTLLAKSARGASLLIILQIASRGLTFIVNQILLRFLSPQLLAISTQLEVYSITVLLFSRESLRIALQRQPNSSSDVSISKNEGQGAVDSRTAAGKSQAIVNLSYISLPFSIVFASSLALIWAPSADVLSTPYFRESLLMHGIATFIELLAEPCFVIVQQNCEFGIRARAESIATFLRCIITCASAAAASSYKVNIGVLPFALGQWGYAVMLPVVYYWRIYPISVRGGFSLLMRPIYSVQKSEFIFSYFSRPLLWLSCTLFAQSVIKHFLTQGDTILISYLASLEAQGQFALASNYGGLIARLVFQPIEESSRSYFGKVLSPASTEYTDTALKIDGPGEQKESKPSSGSVKTASIHLHHLLRLYTLLALLTTTLLPTLLPLLLTLLTTSPSTMISGHRPSPSISPWTSPALLSTLTTYTHLLPLLSLNGLLEAFLTSTASPATLSLQTIFYTLFSFIYIGITWVLVGVWGLEARGIVWANMVNMVVRIGWSGWAVDGWLRRFGGDAEEGFHMKGDIGMVVGDQTEKSKKEIRRGARSNSKGKEMKARGLNIASVLPSPFILAIWIATLSILDRMRGAEVGGVMGLFTLLRFGVVTKELMDLVKVGVVMGGFVGVLAISERELLMNAYRSIRSR